MFLSVSSKSSIIFSYNISRSYNSCSLTSHCIVGPLLQCLVCLANVDKCYYLNRGITFATFVLSGNTPYSKYVEHT